MRPLVTIAILQTLALPAMACLWDSDTLYDEIHNKLTIQNAIAGRVDRNPPEYYQRRLEIASATIQRNTGFLAAYDDAAVACDRLGRHDEGLTWLAKKRAQIPKGDSDALYKYFANDGTIRFHRWLARGRPAGQLDDARLAKDHIAEAIRINPDAHFGREKVQLLAMEWILDPPEWKPGDKWSLYDYVHLERKLKPKEAVDGAVGLIMLGNAWESVDVLNLLGESLPVRDFSAQRLVTYRIQELEAKKQMSVTGEPAEIRPSPLLPTQERLAREAYVAMRANADAYRKNRDEFILARLREGKHPDTDGDFWNGYKEVPPFVVPRPGLMDRVRVFFENPNSMGQSVLYVAGFSAALAVLVYLRQRIRARRQLGRAKGLSS